MMNDIYAETTESLALATFVYLVIQRTSTTFNAGCEYYVPKVSEEKASAFPPKLLNPAAIKFLTRLPG